MTIGKYLSFSSSSWQSSQPLQAQISLMTAGNHAGIHRSAGLLIGLLIPLLYHKFGGLPVYNS